MLFLVFSVNDSLERILHSKSYLSWQSFIINPFLFYVHFKSVFVASLKREFAIITQKKCENAPLRTVFYCSQLLITAFYVCCQRINAFACIRSDGTHKEDKSCLFRRLALSEMSININKSSEINGEIKASICWNTYREFWALIIIVYWNVAAHLWWTFSVLLSFHKLYLERNGLVIISVKWMLEEETDHYALGGWCRTISVHLIKRSTLLVYNVYYK